jgi:hypothetical protein
MYRTLMFSLASIIATFAAVLFTHEVNTNLLLF